MPFSQQTPRTFTKQSIEALNPNQSGVYGIYNQAGWVYVGKGDIRQRLLDHINGDKPCILRALPTHWVGDLCMDPMMSLKEKQLIREFDPPCNERIG